MANQKLRVILVSGCSRSGTTVLDNILGQSAGFFSGGELVDFWHVAQDRERVCVCGTRLRQCDIWKGVFRRLDDDVFLSALVKEKVRDHYQYLRLRNLWRLATRKGRKRFLQLASERTRETLELYHVISEESGARTIVDSSKSVERAYLLTQNPDLDTYVIHLVRDARAVAFSGRRKKPDPSVPNSYMQTYVPASSALRWILSQQVERLCNIPGRYLMMRYEDFIASPDRELQRIFTMIGEPAERRPKIMNHTICLNRIHSINGNASRFRKGPVILQLDDEWRSAMSVLDRATVSALTWPLLRHYGYELNGRPAAQDIVGAVKS